MGEETFLPARQEDDAELEALGSVERHQGDAIAVAPLIGVHDERDVLQKALKRVEVVHETGEFFQVFEP